MRPRPVSPRVGEPTQELSQACLSCPSDSFSSRGHSCGSVIQPGWHERGALYASPARCATRRAPAPSCPRGAGALTNRPEPGENAWRPRRAFPHAQVADREPGLLADGDRDPPARGPIELGEDDPGDPERFGEGPRLRNGVLPGGRIENEQGLVWRPGDLARDHALRLAEFLHQILARVQRPG